MRKKLYCVLVLILFACFIIGCKGGNAPKNETVDNRTPVVKVDKITVNTPTLPDATMDKPYSFDFAAAMDPQGGGSPYHYELGSMKGFPPMGLILSPSGILRGTPSVKESVKFDVCAVGIGGDFACATVTLNVKIADKPKGDYFLYAGNWSGVFSYFYREGHEEENKKTNNWEMVWTEWKPAEIDVMVTLEPTFPEFSFEENLLKAKMNNFWFMNITKASVSDPGFGTGADGVYLGNSKPFPSVASLPYNATPFSLNPMVAAYLNKEQLEMSTMAMKKVLGLNMYFPNGAQLMTYPGILQVSTDGLTLSNSDEAKYANETWMPINVSSGLLSYYRKWAAPPGEIVKYTVEYQFTGWELHKGLAPPKIEIEGQWEGTYFSHNTYDDTGEALKKNVEPTKCSTDTIAYIKICFKKDGKDVTGDIDLINIKDTVTNSCNIVKHCGTIFTNDCGNLYGKLDSKDNLAVTSLILDGATYNNNPEPDKDRSVSTKTDGNWITTDFSLKVASDQGYSTSTDGFYTIRKVSDDCTLDYSVPHHFEVKP